MKVLLVEDNARLAERITHHLKKNYTIDIAESGEDALEKIQQVQYGVILLDLGLPGISGLEVCKNMRTLHFENPILVLTGSVDVAEKVQLLNAGADDYVTKPFNTDELRARITAVARRQPKNQLRSIFEYKDLRLDAEKHVVSRSGISIQLRRKEFDILEYLLTNKGRIMTREMIMDHVWSSHTNSWKSVVDVHIKHLRDKVDKPFASAYIKTAYGLGYKIEEA